jgi:hypothetical protein
MTTDTHVPDKVFAESEIFYRSSVRTGTQQLDYLPKTLRLEINILKPNGYSCTPSF